MTPDDTDTNVILAAQQGQPVKFGEFIERTRSRLARQLLCCGLTRDIGEDLPDALAEGALLAWRFLASYRADLCPAYGWLWVLTRNAALSILRRRARVQARRVG